MNELQKLLDAHPEFKQTLTQFMMLYDAAEVLAEVQPPHASTAAAYLRAVADTLIRETGLPEVFLQAMIRTRPAVPV